MNLKGGYKILLLSTLSLVEVETAITDKKVLEQLSTLIGYMGKKELKPILIHCGIEKDSEVTKHCVMGELKKISDTEYVIIGKIDKAYLTISVEFSQDEETEEYYIASGDATYILSETTKVGDLVVDGGITSKGIANTGNIANTGDIATIGKITGGEIVENMSGYSFELPYNENPELTIIYASVVKNGNKLTFVVFGKYNRAAENPIINPNLGRFNIPAEIGAKITPWSGFYVDSKNVPFFASASSITNKVIGVEKRTATSIEFTGYGTHTLNAGTDYMFRIEETFLLSENLVSEE